MAKWICQPWGVFSEDVECARELCLSRAMASYQETGRPHPLRDACCNVAEEPIPSFEPLAATTVEVVAQANASDLAPLLSEVVDESSVPANQAAPEPAFLATIFNVSVPS